MLDDDKTAPHADFEGFSFLEYGATKKKSLAAGCPRKDYVAFDLTRSRLIGFRVIISDYQQGQQNIRAICPLLDTPDCAETELYLSETRDLSAEIGNGYDS
jgi:hypothetical protein